VKFLKMHVIGLSRYVLVALMATIFGIAYSLDYALFWFRVRYYKMFKIKHYTQLEIYACGF